METHRNRHDHGRNFTDTPHERAAHLLVVQRRQTPSAPQIAEPRSFQERLGVHDRYADEGVVPQGCDQHNQAHRVLGAVRNRVNADKHQHEDIARERKVNHHEFVPDMVPQHHPEKRREINDNNRSRKVYGGKNGVCNNFRPSRMHDAHNPLARASRTVLTGFQRLKQQRYGRAQYQQNRHDHREHHMLKHMHRKQHTRIYSGWTGSNVVQHEQP